MRTKSKAEAEQLLQTKRLSVQQPHLNLAMARTLLAATDGELLRRTWKEAMAEFVTRSRRDSTRARRERAMRHRAFDLIRNKKIIETTADDLRAVLQKGGVFINHCFRCVYNLAIGLGWLPWPILPSKLWPIIQSKPKRGITWQEHQKIIQNESNAERKAFYELLWEIGASQSDAAALNADNINWENRTLSYQRQKTGEWAYLTIGPRLEALLKLLPPRGCFFPTLAIMPNNWRSAEFRRRCRLLNIEGVSLLLTGMRAERAKQVGLPECFAQQALGQSSAPVHRAYARGGKAVRPSLEEYEKKII